MPRCSVCNSKVMKHLWCGKCFYLFTSYTHQIGVIGVQCPHFCSSMGKFSLLHIHCSALILVLRCIMRCFVFFAFLGCTSITFTQTTNPLSGLQSCMLSAGSLCWLVDRLFCKDISRWFFNPQGHAMWHVFMGLNSYYANTFLMYCRA